MGRRNDGDSAMYNSSIALLQERSKELQRVRERRQEKELLKLVSESDQRVSSPMNLDPNRLALLQQPDRIILHDNISPSSSSVTSPFSTQDSPLSLGLNSSRKSEFRARKSFASLWPNTGSSSSRGYENSDVDTSLHL